MTEYKIAIIGLGYVGLPLAVEFGKKTHTVGFDINGERIKELADGRDSTLECSPEDILSSNYLNFTSSVADIEHCNIYIVTVPTPVDVNKQPDVTPLKKASEMIANVIGIGDVIIYESTVYPGATEEVCVPILERHSGLKFNKDFFVGYSPERINPGDKVRTLTNITKITSGSNSETARIVDDLYRSVVTAGTHLASSIKVAEAAKVIENTQRDVNIALINEMAIIFSKLGIDTLEVLEAAGTKWNFLPFRPGLVGGHCIGVDPYYLTHKAQSVGYYPDIILASRRLNDGMGSYVAGEFVKLLIKKGINPGVSRVLVMGFTFKENCPDLRNSKVIDLVRELSTYNIYVDIYDPWCNKEEAKNEYDVELLENIPKGVFDGVILAVGHNEFKSLGLDNIRDYCNESNVIYDLKYIFDKELVDKRL